MGRWRGWAGTGGACGAGCLGGTAGREDPVLVPAGCLAGMDRPVGWRLDEGRAEELGCWAGSALVRLRSTIDPVG